MYHSITFGDKNTWDDWKLIPTTRPAVQPPETNTNFVNIPGGTGEMDLSEVLTGYPTYKDRTGSFEFATQNIEKPWNILYHEVQNYLHGRTMRMILEDDFDYYYEGRYYVSEYSTDNAAYSVIKIDYQVRPFKMELYGTMDDWLWDPFNFYSGVIRYTKDIPVYKERAVTIENCGTKHASPIIYASFVNATVEGNGEEPFYQKIEKERFGLESKILPSQKVPTATTPEGSKDAVYPTYTTVAKQNVTFQYFIESNVADVQGVLHFDLTYPYTGGTFTVNGTPVQFGSGKTVPIDIPVGSNSVDVEFYFKAMGAPQKDTNVHYSTTYVENCYLEITGIKEAVEGGPNPTEGFNTHFKLTSTYLCSGELDEYDCYPVSDVKEGTYKLHSIVPYEDDYSCTGVDISYTVEVPRNGGRTWLEFIGDDHLYEHDWEIGDPGEVRSYNISHYVDFADIDDGTGITKIMFTYITDGLQQPEQKYYSDTITVTNMRIVYHMADGTGNTKDVVIGEDGDDDIITSDETVTETFEKRVDISVPNLASSFVCNSSLQELINGTSYYTTWRTVSTARETVTIPLELMSNEKVNSGMLYFTHTYPYTGGELKVNGVTVVNMADGIGSFGSNGTKWTRNVPITIPAGASFVDVTFEYKIGGKRQTDLNVHNGTIYVTDAYLQLDCERTVLVGAGGSTGDSGSGGSGSVTAPGMTVTYEGVTYQLVNGENHIPEIRLYDGDRTLIFNGYGTVSVDYHGGWL